MPRHRRSRSAAASELPAQLNLLIHSAELECPPGHADALRALATLALHKIPARGIFDPAARGEQELYVAIDSVARTHLKLANAKSEWRSALDEAQLPLEPRDRIERSALEVQSISDTAYFYAGLAFGLAYAAICRAA
jgi:hypothetical protein